MLKLISKLGLGDPCATNVQIVKNLSQWDIAITIVSGQNIWSDHVRTGETKRINVSRNEIGIVRAKTIITYSDGRILEYEFRIDPLYCEDNVIVLNDCVDYNFENRGLIINKNVAELSTEQSKLEQLEPKQ